MRRARSRATASATRTDSRAAANDRGSAQERIDLEQLRDAPVLAAAPVALEQPRVDVLACVACSPSTPRPASRWGAPQIREHPELERMHAREIAAVAAARSPRASTCRTARPRLSRSAQPRRRHARARNAASTPRRRIRAHGTHDRRDLARRRTRRLRSAQLERAIAALAPNICDRSGDELAGLRGRQSARDRRRAPDGSGPRATRRQPTPPIRQVVGQLAHQADEHQVDRVLQRLLAPSSMRSLSARSKFENRCVPPPVRKAWYGLAEYRRCMAALQRDGQDRPRDARSDSRRPSADRRSFSGHRQRAQLGRRHRERTARAPRRSVPDTSPACAAWPSSQGRCARRY